MSEPIVWEHNSVWDEYTATVDGVSLRAGRRGERFVVAAYMDESAATATNKSRDLAARAVVAAVKVLRGETDAAVAAERERCAKEGTETREALERALQFWRWTVPSPQTEPPWVKVACRVEAELNGAPAPREG